MFTDGPSNPLTSPSNTEPHAADAAPNPSAQGQGAGAHGFANLVSSMKHHHLNGKGREPGQDRQVESNNARKPSKGLPDTGLASSAAEERVNKRAGAKSRRENDEQQQEKAKSKPHSDEQEQEKAKSKPHGNEQEQKKQRQNTIPPKDVKDPHIVPPTGFTDGPGILPTENSKIPDSKIVPNMIQFPMTDSPPDSPLDEEQQDGQSSKRENTLPAENGAIPEALPPAKAEEEAPGNRNEIWLEARGGDLHVSVRSECCLGV
jgi:hypothetical protein